MRFYTLEDIANELHIRPGTARNRLALGQGMPPSIRIGRRRLFPVSEYEHWVARVIAPLKEAGRKDAFPASGPPRKLPQADRGP